MLGAKQTFAAIPFLFAFAMSASQPTNQLGRATVILAPPLSSSSYYAVSYTAIVDFMVLYANKIIQAGNDNVILLVDAKTKANIGTRLPQDVLLLANVEDIWMRDFSLVGLNSQVQFVYRPDYLSATDSRYIQRSLTDEIAACSDTNYIKSNLVLDGGNVVDNFVDSAIVTDRILKDNPQQSQAAIEQELRIKLRYSRIAIIPSEPGETTGHSDGMVSFLDEKTLAVSPPDDTIKDQLWSKLREVFSSGFNFITLNSVYKNEVWRGFYSACGLHVNTLATNNTLYVPTFGTDVENQKRGQSTEKDAEVLAQIRAAVGSKKSVIDVPVPYEVCRMGGNVRCLSWAAKGAIADQFVQRARTGNCG